MAENYEAIDLRLTSIENTLRELKNVVVETKLQERDIKELEEKNKEILQAINSHDKRIKDLEIRPAKEKADKWTVITDGIFKALVSVVIGWLFVKVGLK